MFDWGEYLRLGRSLGGCSADPDEKSREAKRRSSVSRAYYSAFHIAKQHLEKKYGKKTGDHGGVWNALQEGATTDAEKEAGREGDRLYTARRRADYVDVCKNPEKDAEYALRTAKKVCALLGQHI